MHWQAILILHDPKTGAYHAALFQEAPFPGPAETRYRHPRVMRLRSRMHHTVGAMSLEGAQAHADELASKIPDAKLFRDWVEPFDSKDYAMTLLIDPAKMAA